MNKLKSLFIASLLICSVSIAKADITGGASAWNYTHMTDSGVVTSVSAELGAVYLSSGPLGTADWGVVIDTVAIANVTDRATFSMTDRMTPAIVFSSIAVVNLGLNQNWNVVSEDGNGLKAKNGIYWLPSAAGSGEARQAIIKWRRGRVSE